MGGAAQNHLGGGKGCNLLNAEPLLGLPLELHQPQFIGVGNEGAVGALASTSCKLWGHCPHNQSHPIFVVLALTIGSPHEIHEQV